MFVVCAWSKRRPHIDCDAVVVQLKTQDAVTVVVKHTAEQPELHL
jgi:hypothetical protein